MLYYHRVSEKQIVGLDKITKESYPDPTAEEGDWSAVDLAPVKALAQPVSLEAIRKDELLGRMLLVRQSRLSVMPVTPDEFKRVLALAKTSL